MIYAIAFMIVHAWQGAPDAGRPERGAACDPALAALFAPRAALVGRYEVCADPRPLADVAPREWTVEALEAFDAFGSAGAYNRAALARLFGGQRARVARGWTRSGDRFEAATLISPHPNRTLTRLESGTLVIRWICDRGNAQCAMHNAK
jgi:hypothetical protein